MLLIASCLFYMWFIPKYILILGATILIDYAAAILIERSGPQKKKMYLLISIISTCAILFVFKYFNFFSISFQELSNVLGWNYSPVILEYMLPMGLSFHTFQSLAYVIEVYRGNQKAERHFGIYSLYVMFYPQLVAGPIERPQNLLPQFRNNHRFNYHETTDGLKLMAWGLFKKVVIADRLAIFVNAAYENPKTFEGPFLLIATIFFAFQIYCDFSGYSDIAIGSAKVMGIDLMTNFKNPYFSKSISEFWRRWHISLSTWFKDYIYIPLGGNKKSMFRWQLNLFLTFTLSGLWHGANWTYLIWGGLNGLFLVLANLRDKIFKRPMPQSGGFFDIIVTFSLICFSWIFFRSNNLEDALWIIKQILSFSDYSHLTINNYSKSNLFNFYFSFFLIGLLILTEYLQIKNWSLNCINKSPLIIRNFIYGLFLLIIIICGVYGDNKFIYFQF